MSSNVPPKPENKENHGRVVFVNRYYYPDFSATSQMLTDVAEDLAGGDKDIIIITSSMTYDDPSQRLPGRETINGVEIKRVRTTRFGRSNLLGRALDYVTFYFSSFFSLLHTLRPSDIVVAKTDPPLLSVPAGLAARFKSAELVNWLQDIFPEAAAELGVKSAGGFFESVLLALRNRSLHRAKQNVVIGARMQEHVQALGVPGNQITLIANFCDDTSISPVAIEDNCLRAEWGFTQSDFVIGYSGNLGRAHDLSTMLGAAEALKDDNDIRFLFIGGGHLRSQLEREAKTRGLTNIITKPYQPRSDLRRSLGVPNIHWASLNPRLEGLILPSKLYGIAASGKPLLMIGDPQGDIGQIVSSFKFGACIPPGETDTLVAVINFWKSQKGKCIDMGANARAFIEAAGARRFSIEAWRALLDIRQSGEDL